MFHYREELKKVIEMGRIIADEEVRGLFISFCDEVARFGGEIKIETTRFEVRFFTDRGFSVSISPYPEIFVVSVGPPPHIDIRVAGEKGIMKALDISLAHFLGSYSAAEDSAWASS